MTKVTKPKGKKVAKTRKAIGRPTLYRPEYDAEAASFSLGGLTIAEMAVQWGVVESTVYEWIKDYPEFSEAIKANRDRADMPVVAAGLKRATGYTYMKAIPFKVKDVVYDQGKRVRETERVEVVYAEEHVPPDTAAFKWWLSNRQAKYWSDKSEVVHKLPKPVTEMTPDELLAVTQGRGL